MAITMAVVLWGCANVPRHYVRMAEPGTTLTALTAHPEMYRGKVVLLGGTIIEEEENEQDLWLHLTNRPLDQDYIPHRPADMDGPEAGSFWVVVAKQQFPREYRQWARMTVVGRVTGTGSGRILIPIISPQLREVSKRIRWESALAHIIREDFCCDCEKAEVRSSGADTTNPIAKGVFSHDLT